MGCWEETCVLTLTPIYSGDSVVCVVYANDVLFDYQRNSSPQACALKYVIDIQFGTYDDYGWLTESDSDRPQAVVVFFHKQAWDFLVKTGRDEDDRYLREYIDFIWEEPRVLQERKYSKAILNKLSREVVRDLLYVIRWCTLFRRDLWITTNHAGHQEHTCTKKLKRELHKLTGEIIKNLPRD